MFNCLVQGYRTRWGRSQIPRDISHLTVRLSGVAHSQPISWCVYLVIEVFVSKSCHLGKYGTGLPIPEGGMLTVWYRYHLPSGLKFVAHIASDVCKTGATIIRYVVLYALVDERSILCLIVICGHYGGSIFHEDGIKNIRHNRSREFHYIQDDAAILASQTLQVPLLTATGSNARWV